MYELIWPYNIYLQVTRQTIKSIDRSLHNLKSKLQVSPTIVYNNQYQLTKDCDDAHEKYFIDIKSELGNEIYVQDVELANGIMKKSNPTPGDNNALECQILFVETPPKKKRKLHATKKIQTKKKKLKTNEIAIKQESDYIDDQNFSDLDDVPLVSLTRNDVTDDERDKNTENRDENSKKTVKRSSGPKFNASYFEDYATVVLLTQEEAAKEVLLRKQSSNYLNCQFKCDLCYRAFEAVGTYNNHMKKHGSVSFKSLQVP